MTSTQRTVAVDFDGVVHTYPAWDGEIEARGEPIPGALDALHGLHALGVRIVIHSCRPVPNVRAWLRRHGVEDLVAAVTRVKPIADAYFDDRAVPVVPNEPHAFRLAVDGWLARYGRALPGLDDPPGIPVLGNPSPKSVPGRPLTPRTTPREAGLFLPPGPEEGTDPDQRTETSP